MRNSHEEMTQNLDFTDIADFFDSRRTIVTFCKLVQIFNELVY